MLDMVHSNNIITNELVVLNEVNIEAKHNESVNDVTAITIAVDVRP